MTHLYEVTFSHFRIENGVAKAASGATRMRGVPSLEMLQMMMIFQDISPIQHFEAEPTMTILTRRGDRFLVRTDLHKLLFYNAAQVQQPARVLEAASILLEIEDQKYELRAEINARFVAAAEEKARRLAQWREQPWAHFGALLASVVACLAAWAYRPSDPEPRTEWVETPARILALRQSLMGSYTTGNGGPGEHGITLLPTGEMRFLQLGGTPPAQLRSTYRLGMRDHQLHLLAPGMPAIRVAPEGLRMGDLVFTKR